MDINNELISILDKYNPKWNEESLDGDEVEELTRIIRTELNYLNGNISDYEYDAKTETPYQGNKYSLMGSVNNLLRDYGG